MGRMTEQGAGGMDSGFMGHARTKSDADAVPPKDTAVDSRGKTTSEDDTEFAPAVTSDQVPRRADERHESAAPKGMLSSTVARNPSSSSTRSESPLTRGNSSSSQTNGPIDFSRSAPSGPVEPPVTKTTLSELDVNKIIHNPKLRHDINFDPELHFRPNLDGEKGRRKQQKADQFWASLKEQLTLFVTDRETFLSRYGEDAQWCLPRLLKAVKDIIQTLVPSRDRRYLSEGLNVELLIQQFNRGVADLEKLASWLSSVLKLHCAPMRDEWVDEMYRELSNGNRNNDINELVKGMRSLLSVLEAMKLDVANHQIRCLRPMLIEDTVNFQQRLFYKKLQARKLPVDAAKRWYSRSAREHSGVATHSEALHSLGDMATFFYGLSNLVLPSSSTPTVPDTFVFDEDRILKLRSDAADAICLDICMRQYEDLEQVSQMMPPSMSNAQPPTLVPAYILEEETVRSNRSSVDFDFNTPPTSSSRLSWQSGSSPCLSNTPSPRNSGCMFPQVAPTSAADSRAKSAKLYSTLVDLLQTAPSMPTPQQRWQSLVPDVAIQIMRFVNAPQDLLPLIERRLEDSLADFNSDKFLDAQHSFHSRLFSELAGKVREFKSLSGLSLFTAATNSRVTNPGGRSQGASQFLQVDRSRQATAEEHGLEDMATRMAHIGLLHWRVWSELVYREVDVEGDESMEMSDA